MFLKGTQQIRDHFKDVCDLNLLESRYGGSLEIPKIFWPINPKYV